MKFSLIAVLLTFSVTTMAAEDMAEVKAAQISHFDMRIAHLQEAKACVSAATTKDAMRACRQKMHEKMKAMKDAGMAEKKSRKEKREKKK